MKLGYLAPVVLALSACVSSPVPQQVNPQDIGQRQVEKPQRQYNISANQPIRMRLSHRQTFNGKSEETSFELYDTDRDRKTVEQAIVTRRSGYQTTKVVFLRNDSEIAERPRDDEDVRTMTPENEETFDGLYGGSR